MGNCQIFQIGQFFGARLAGASEIKTITLLGISIAAVAVVDGIHK
jgi:hypothetical protein